MTWIVGTAGGFGYGIGLSDIRVTLSDGTERDCLQKIYKVGNFIAAGFAGSVAIGFGLIDKLAGLLACDDATLAWDPVTIAGWWPRDARETFNGFTLSERELGSHVILIGAHPTEHNGNPNWPRNYVYTFRSPDFQPVRILPPEVAAIGCGAQFGPCRAAVRSLSTDHNARFQMMKGEQGCPGGMATLLAFRLTLLLQENRPPGVSAHLHCCWVYRGKVVIAPQNYSKIGNWMAFHTGVEAAEKALSETADGRGDFASPGMELFQMPPIAKSFAELEQMLRAGGLSAVGAIA
jgi:hypothetical protein